MIFRSSKPSTLETAKLPALLFIGTLLVGTLVRFHQGGGNLAEVSDMCVSILDWIAETTRREFHPEVLHDVLPDCVVFDEGSNNFAAFGVEACGQDAVDTTRSWLQSY